jgi:hypothetical protein
MFTLPTTKRTVLLNLEIKLEVSKRISMDMCHTTRNLTCWARLKKVTREFKSMEPYVLFLSHFQSFLFTRWACAIYKSSRG